VANSATATSVQEQDAGEVTAAKTQLANGFVVGGPWYKAVLKSVTTLSHKGLEVTGSYQFDGPSLVTAGPNGTARVGVCVYDGTQLLNVQDGKPIPGSYGSTYAALVTITMTPSGTTWLASEEQETALPAGTSTCTP
jgi:hypothetical protein